MVPRYGYGYLTLLIHKRVFSCTMKSNHYWLKTSLMCLADFLHIISTWIINWRRTTLFLWCTIVHKIEPRWTLHEVEVITLIWYVFNVNILNCLILETLSSPISKSNNVYKSPKVVIPIGTIFYLLWPSTHIAHVANFTTYFSYQNCAMGRLACRHKLQNRSKKCSTHMGFKIG